MNFNDHDIKDEVVVSRDENAIALEFVIPATSDFFDGHFPQYKLLPAVAQFEVITRFSRKYFGTQRYVPNIKRIKFSVFVSTTSSPKRVRSLCWRSIRHQV